MCISGLLEPDSYYGVRSVNPNNMGGRGSPVPGIPQTARESVVVDGGTITKLC